LKDNEKYCCEEIVSEEFCLGLLILDVHEKKIKLKIIEKMVVKEI
jgi:hypothetical protein